MARVVAVNISEKKGTFKHPVDQVTLMVDHGIQGDAHAGNWHRQVSLLAQESIDKMAAMGVDDLTPGKFAENITTQGIDLVSLPVGSRLWVGEVLMEVTQIGKECHHHCQIYQQVGMCVMPTEGIFTKVIKEGTVKAGDEIVTVPSIRAAVITISDKGSSGAREDKSGPALVEALKDLAVVNETLIIPDERDQIEAALCRLADAGATDVIFTTGGTGFAPRDVTPEATLAVIDRAVPGIPEAMRQASAQITPRAMLSRAAAGIRKRTLIVNLPGSPKAAVECLQVFLPVMVHAVETLRGETYECGRK
ncbi:MAG: MOSC domain-containing protein [Anaerolineae bacterium]|jgi:molybdenum cofactor synthesis domain-containing protein|nr:MOSC domain-containing protein [Anaerolineae bacterium]